MQVVMKTLKLKNFKLELFVNRKRVEYPKKKKTEGNKPEK